MEPRGEKETTRISRAGRGRLKGKCKMNKDDNCTLRNGSQGFSLLELLVVLMLFGLTSLLVLPAMDKKMKQLEVRKSALKLAAVARNLRSKAVFEGSLQRLILDPYSNSYQVSEGPMVRLASGVRISAIAGGAPWGEGMTQFHFFPNGRILGGEIGVSGQEGRASYITRFNPLSGRIAVIKEKTE